MGDSEEAGAFDKSETGQKLVKLAELDIDATSLPPGLSPRVLTP